MYLGIGLALAFAGVGADQPSSISSTGDAGQGSDVLGVALCLVSAVVYSISLILQKPLVARAARPIHVTWLACTVGAVVCLPFLGQLVDQTAGADVVRCWWIVYPRHLPDGDRLHDVRLRAPARRAQAASA